MNTSLKSYHDLEIDAHVSLDDVLSKITQEMGELMTAVSHDDAPEIQKEAADVLVNILSVAGKMDIETSEPTEPAGSLSQLPLLIAEFHRHVAAVRGKYSRDTADREGLLQVTQQLVNMLLPLTQFPSAQDVVVQATEKFRIRVEAYIPDIDLKEYIQAYADFPKPGITFQDISPLLACPLAMQFACFELAKKAKNADVIAGLDARGFLFGIPVAQILGKPFVMIRKKGKLPGATLGMDYSLEYGSNSIEIQKDALLPGQNVVIIDDLLATGGTFLAAAQLVERTGARVEGLLSLIALDENTLLSHPTRIIIDRYKPESVLHYS